MALEFDQFSTARPLIPGYPAWVADPQEQARIAAYQLYEQIYWTVPETFKLMQRGQDTQPIYIPSGRVIVETLHRYMANDLRIIIDPEFGTTQEQQLASLFLENLLARERFYSMFNANKRYGIMRGDWAFQLMADPTLPEGSRISILPIDPASLFPVYEEGTPDTIIGWHIVDQFMDNDGKAKIRRLTYRKVTGTAGPSPITMEEAVFEADQWGGPGMKVEDEKKVMDLRPPITLPPQIDYLPIYNIPNFDEPGALWGSSEMRGLEAVMAAVNQSISDEELTLAMDGLGTYATNAGAPIDETTGQELPWGLGPAKVVEVPPEAFFNRVSGVTSVTPYLDHINYLHEQLDLATSTPAVAKGIVDVTVAESGIALAIQFGPLLFKAQEKELIVTDKLNQIFYDLGKWAVAYEGSQFSMLMDKGDGLGPTVRIKPVYGDKLPENKQQVMDNLFKGVEQKLIPHRVAWDQMRALGVKLPPNEEMEKMLLEQTVAMGVAEADPLAGRINGELDAIGQPQN